MSIKLRLEKGAIVMQAVLDDAAFSDLLETIQRHESKDATPSPISVAGSGSPSPSAGEASNASPGLDSVQVIKRWLIQQTAAEVLNVTGWAKNTDKILLLGAHFEAKGGNEGWKSSDMEGKFAEAKEGFPGNFARDIANAVKEGIIATVTPRTYTVSRSGWKRISDAIGKAGV